MPPITLCVLCVTCIRLGQPKYVVVKNETENRNYVVLIDGLLKL